MMEYQVVAGTSPLGTCTEWIGEDEGEGFAQVLAFDQVASEGYHRSEVRRVDDDSLVVAFVGTEDGRILVLEG